MRFLSFFLLAQTALAIPIPPSQRPEELAYQLAKYYQLAGEKQIICERKKTETLAPNEAKDYGNFSLKAQADTLSFSGNPGLTAGRVELSLNDLTTITFGDSALAKFVTVIPVTSTLFEKGSSDATLMAMEAGSVTKSTQLICKLQ